MTAEEAALLASLPALAFQASLVFCRMAAAGMLLPGLGEQEVPANIRLGLAVLITLLLLPLLAPLLPAAPEHPFDLLRLILGEIVVGLWLGSLARLLASTLAQAGQVIGTMMGLTTPLQGDMVLGAQGTPLGRLFGFLATVLLLATGLYALPLAALLNSYALLPPGGGFPGGGAAEAMAVMVAHSFELALRLAAPFILAGVLFNLGLGLVARVAPQVQIFVVAAPAQILAGFGLLILLLPAILLTWREAMQGGFQSLPFAP
jgi:flagellar biosynthetic protein FliR